MNHQKSLFEALGDAKLSHREARKVLAEYIGRERLPILDIDIAYTIWGAMVINDRHIKDDDNG